MLRTTLLLLAPVFACAQSLPDFEKKVTEFTLPNGMHFIVLERHGAPVVSFNSYVNAGSVDDPSGGRLVEEGRILANLGSHPNLVRVYDLAQTR